MAYELQWTREGSGVCRHHKRESVSQPDDPNDVVILQDVADASKARTWLTSNEMKLVMEKSGVVGAPNIRFAAAA
jgi:hypothetical protein